MLKTEASPVAARSFRHCFKHKSHAPNMTVAFLRIPRRQPVAVYTSFIPERHQCARDSLCLARRLDSLTQPRHRAGSYINIK